MKKRKSLLAVLIAIPALLLSSCDLLPGLNTPSRRKSSKEEEEISEPSRSSSSKSTEKTSSYHSHTFGSWTTTKQATCVEEGEQVRVCSICGIEQFRTIARTDHQWGDWQMQVAPSCVEEGRRIKECVVCGVTSTENVPALGHDYDYENASWQQEPTCDQVGYGTVRCKRCGESFTEEFAPYGHDITAVGGETTPPAGEATVRLYECSRCHIQFMNFSVSEVTEESKKHLVTSDYGEDGLRFYGRPIGNALALAEDGTSINQQNNEIVYSSTETGDYFEYVFTLNADQAAVLSTCRCYCDARPADHLSGDFWAYGRSNTDWTPGYYIDGGEGHYQTNDDGTPVMVKDHARTTTYGVAGQELSSTVKMGKRVEDYRYVLYVDGVVQEFDPDTSVPAKGSGTNMTRAEYEIPFTFHLHEGRNRISLHMAGGYRSTFYNFTFRPYVEPTPVAVNETSLTIHEGKTAQITSPMTGLTYASSSTSVATVDANGLVTGVKVGTTTITVSKEGNFKPAKIPVTVTEAEGVIVLNLDDGTIDPIDGVEIYNSSSSGMWYRSFKKDATVTYTFQSELAGKYNIRLGLRGSNIVLDENIAIKVNGVDVSISGTVSTSYSAVEYIVGQADLVMGSNTMIITALADCSLYLKSLRFIPID